MHVRSGRQPNLTTPASSALSLAMQSRISSIVTPFPQFGCVFRFSYKGTDSPIYFGKDIEDISEKMSPRSLKRLCEHVLSTVLLISSSLRCGVWLLYRVSYRVTLLQPSMICIGIDSSRSRRAGSTYLGGHRLWSFTTHLPRIHYEQYLRNTALLR